MAPDDRDDPTSQDASHGPRTWGLKRVPSSVALAVAGIAVVAALLFLIGVGALRESAGVLAAIAGVLVLTTWALALLFDPAPADARRRRGLVISVIAWFAILPVLRWLWLSAVTAWPLFGNLERLFLLPILAVLLLALGRRLGLGRWPTRIAILVVAFNLVTESIPPDWPMEMVAAAGPAELAGAQRAAAGPAVARGGQQLGTPILLASARHDHGMAIAPPPARPGMRCERVKVRDQRRTLLGAESRRLEITADACWAPDGKPYTVRLIADARAGDTQSNPRAVRLITTDPFRLDNVPDSDGSYGAAPSQNGDPSYANLHPFDDDARVRLGRSIYDAAQVRVDPTGRVIELTIGWLFADPLARAGNPEPGAPWLDAGSAPDRWPRTVSLGFRPRRGEVLDVFTAQFDREGDPDGELVRIHPGGTTDLLAPAPSANGAAPRIVRSQPVGSRPTLVLPGGR